MSNPRWRKRYLALFPLILACPGMTYGQVIAEHAVITGATSGGAAGAKGIGRSIGTVFNKAASSLESASGSAAARKPERSTGTSPRQAVVPAAEPSRSGTPVPVPLVLLGHKKNNLL
jgi:hypothetical protein